jgi:hypothetical protein
MNSEKTLIEIKKYCITNSGDEQRWENKGTQYYWNRGRDTANGLINGVVRKLAGIDANGHQIWVVAGSIKISSDGTIERFTGMPKKQQKMFESVPQPVITVSDTTLETV